MIMIVFFTHFFYDDSDDDDYNDDDSDDDNSQPILMPGRAALFALRLGTAIKLLSVSSLWKIWSPSGWLRSWCWWWRWSPLPPPPPPPSSPPPPPPEHLPPLQSPHSFSYRKKQCFIILICVSSFQWGWMLPSNAWPSLLGWKLAQLSWWWGVMNYDYDCDYDEWLCWLWWLW